MFLNRTSFGFVLSVETLYGKMFYNDTIANNVRSHMD